jgi:Holliday junction DNA helicase RuvB
LLSCDSVSGETPAWIRKQILARDGKRCVLCRRPSLLDAHHIHHRASGGRTEPTNLMTLCRPCHALVHEGLVRISGEAPKHLVITDKEGNPISAAPRRDEGVSVVMRGRRGAAAPPPVSETIEDTRLPNSRCHGLDDVVGQKRLVESLRLLIAGAKSELALDPILLTGEPGFGKSSIAEAIAAELKAPLALVSGPLVRDAATLIEALVRTEARSVLFIDEIHALPIEALNVLLEALEKRRLTMPGRTIALAPFTVIAATNHPERLPNALHSRFATRERLDDYTEDDLATIALRTASSAGLSLSDEDARQIARVSRGTPRECVLLTKRLATMSKGNTETDQTVDALLEAMGIDARGLDPADRKIVTSLRTARRPLSLASLAAKTGIGKTTIQERHEPFLLKLGLVEITPNGRVPAGAIPLAHLAL